jgi:hypothetical protein
MTTAETADALRSYNIWRRGNLDWMPQPDPRSIGVAIDSAIEALDEIERLRAQNATLTDAINAASALMASAPAWHAMHREAIEQLQKVKKEMES